MELRFRIVGAISGLLSCLVFLIYHQLTISNIWFSALFMFIISGLAGYMLVFSYQEMTSEFSPMTWVGYISYFTIGLTFLSVLSVIIFSPIATSAEILNLGGAPPPELIQGAFPLTLVWMIIAGLIPPLVKHRSLKGVGSTLGTSATLYLTLGLNLSILGKVSVSPEHTYLVEKFIIMNIGLGFGYMLIFMVLRKFINET